MSPGTRWRARWVVPVTSPPIHDGAVHVAGGRVVAVGPAAELAHHGSPVTSRDLGDAILLPGLVNAHTHLSLTGLAEKLPRGGPLLTWLGRITREAAASSASDIRAAVRDGLAATRALGTVAVGEITTRADGVAEIEAERRMFARVYFEFLGVSAERSRRRFEAARAAALELHTRSSPRGRVRAGLSPHAPYSVWPTLWPEAAAWCRDHDLRWSSHIAESPFEAEFLRTGRGPLRAHLEGLGVWDDAFPIPGIGITRLWESQRVLDSRALLVHGLHLDSRELDAIAAAGAALCLCPRSNAALELPPPPVQEGTERGVRLCLGTDSLASNEDLGVWGEMRAVRRLAPKLPAEDILRMATVNGALALGLEDLSGGIQPGSPAGLVAVLAPGLGSADPIEHLVQEPVEDRVQILETELEAYP